MRGKRKHCATDVSNPKYHIDTHPVSSVGSVIMLEIAHRSIYFLVAYAAVSDIGFHSLRGYQNIVACMYLVNRRNVSSHWAICNCDPTVTL